MTNLNGKEKKREIETYVQPFPTFSFALSEWGGSSRIEGLVTYVLHHFSGRGKQMEGNELSYSEYLKCNNACVKVTINRYSGLCLGTLRELRDCWSSVLEILRFWRSSGPHEDKQDELLKACIALMRIYLQFINYLLNHIVMAKAEKCEAIDLSSLTAVFRRIVDIEGVDQLYQLKSLPRSCVDIMRLLEKLGERCDLGHPRLRFFRSLILHNFIFPEVIRAGENEVYAASEKRCTIFERPLQRAQQDFEPEEIHHGSGFVIADSFVITNNHVIEEAMSDETLEIRIVNKTTGELPCVVVHGDAVNDLALLYCPGLNLKRHGICPLALSEEALWPSLSVFSFGYPLTHTGRNALFVKGFISGFVERYGREPLIVLNCVLNPGNSGSPVFRRIDDDIKVVGVVAQKHKKEILTLEELSILEEERSTLQMNCASDSRDQFWKSVSLKMYDALNETHCQFGYGNVVPGHLLAEFLSDPSVTSIMDFLKETELCNFFYVQGGTFCEQ